MRGIDRLTEYKDAEFDKIIMHISSGHLKAGKYAGLIKIKDDFKLDKHRLFDDDKSTKE